MADLLNKIGTIAPTDLKQPAQALNKLSNSDVPSFADLLKSSINETNQLQINKEKATTDIATGQVKDLHQAALAIEKAEVSMAKFPDPVVTKPPFKRSFLDRRAVSVVRKLQEEGFETYLVGGCVRDLLLGSRPKDFDIATSAPPEKVRRLFRRSRMIGRRFRIGRC